MAPPGVSVKDVGETVSALAAVTLIVAVVVDGSWLVASAAAGWAVNVYGPTGVAAGTEKVKVAELAVHVDVVIGPKLGGFTTSVGAAVNEPKEGVTVIVAVDVGNPATTFCVGGDGGEKTSGGRVPEGTMFTFRYAESWMPVTSPAPGRTRTVVAGLARAAAAVALSVNVAVLSAGKGLTVTAVAVMLSGTGGAVKFSVGGTLNAYPLGACATTVTALPPRCRAIAPGCDVMVMGPGGEAGTTVISLSSKALVLLRDSTRTVTTPGASPVRIPVFSSILAKDVLLFDHLNRVSVSTGVCVTVIFRLPPTATVVPSG